MKKIIKCLSFFFLTLSLLSCANIDQSITLSIIKDDNFDVTSKNPIKISKGEDATFLLDFHDGYTYLDSTLGSYENGKLTINNALYSTSIKVHSRRNDDLLLNVINNDSLGEVKITPNKKYFKKGERVKISIKSKTNNEFMCLSENYPYRTLTNKTPTSLALTFDHEYTFNINENKTFYTNYFEEGNLNITYHANGGYTASKKDRIHLDYRLSYPHTNPQSLFGSYYFKKEGYVLTSYNTSFDGKGRTIGIGSKIDVSLFKDKKLDLYCIYEKETDPSYFDYKVLENQTLSITKYKGNDDVVVIPRYINNTLVTSISKNSFYQHKLHRLVLHDQMEIINKESFVNCSNLQTLSLYSSIKEIYHSSFIHNYLKKIEINANSYTDFDLSKEKDFSYQIEKIKSLKKPKFIIIGTSEQRFNQSLDSIKKAHPEYDYYLFGAVVRVDFSFILSSIRPYLNENDKVFISMHQHSLHERFIDAKGMLFFEYNYDLLKDIDYQDVKNVLFPCMMEYSLHSNKGIGKAIITPEHGFKGVNEFGGIDRINIITDNEDNRSPSAEYMFYVNENDKAYDYLLPLIHKLPIKNENKYIIWPSINKNALNENSKVLEYESFIKNKFSMLKTFDTISDNIYEGINFSLNDNIHLSSKGTKIREQHWLNTMPF